MAKVLKVIELMSQSPKSWEDAAPGAVDKASKTLQGHAGRIFEDPPCAFKLNRPG